MRCMGVGIFWPFVKNDMKTASQTSFGRLDQCALTVESHDKWELLAALTVAAPEFDLGHRTLGVLKALLTFLPNREITPERHSAIVFPSNRKLSERLNGMPESTLRRHLARLVEMGIISRHSSPNHKRYARHSGGDCQLAFGFDLSPLAVHAAQIHDTAQAVQSRAEQLAILRDQVGVLRQKLLDIASDDAAELLESVRKLLRRKPCESALAQAASDLSQALAYYQSANEATANEFKTGQMSGTDSQNERHIQKSIKYDFDSEDAAESGRTATKAVHPSSQLSEELNTEPNSPGLDLTALVQACPSVQDFYPNELRNWQDADRIAEKLIPMMGIDGSVLHDARVSMGRKHATTVVLCMLEKLGTIRSPGAYLRRLAQKARDGQFSPVPMLKSLLHNQRTAAIVS